MAQSLFELAQQAAGQAPGAPHQALAQPGQALAPFDLALQAAEEPLALGFTDAFTEVTEGGKWKEKLPFLGGAATAEKYLRLWEAADRMERGAQNRDDEELLVAFLQEAQRPKGIGYMVGSILTDLPGFAVEFWASGGVYTGAKKAALGLAGKGLREAVEKAARKGSLRLLERQVAQKAVGKAAVTATRAAAGAAVNTTGQLAAMTLLGEAAGGSRVQANAWRRAMPELQLTEDDANRIAITFHSTTGDFVEQLPKAIADEWIELLSERSGGALLGGAQRIPGVAQVAAMQGQVADWWIRKYPGRMGELLKTVAKKGGWHGPLSEFLEERFGGALRGASGVEEGGLLSNAFPDMEQMAAELIAFSVPTAGAMSAQALTSPGAPVEIEPEGFEPAAQPVRNLTEAERKRHVRRIEEAAGVEIEEVAPEDVPAGVRPELASNRGTDAIYVRSKDGKPLKVSGALPREGVAIIDLAQEGPHAEVLSHELAHQLKAANPKVWEELRERLAEEHEAGLDEAIQTYQRDFEAAHGFRLTDLDLMLEEGVSRMAEDRAGLLWLANSEDGRQALADAVGNRTSLLQSLRDWLAKGVKALGGSMRTTQERRLADIDAIVGAQGTTVEDARAAMLLSEGINTLVGVKPPSARQALLPEGSPFLRLTEGTTDAFLPEKAGGEPSQQALEKPDDDSKPAPPPKAPKTAVTPQEDLEKGDDGPRLAQTAPDMFGQTRDIEGRRPEVVAPEITEGALFQEDTGAKGQTSILDRQEAPLADVPDFQPGEKVYHPGLRDSVVIESWTTAGPGGKKVEHVTIGQPGGMRQTFTGKREMERLRSWKAKTPATKKAAKKLGAKEQARSRRERLAAGGEDVPFRVFLRAHGGVEEHRGDLAEFGGPEMQKGAFGLPRLLQREGSGKGMSFDKALELAAEHGYFQGDPKQAGIDDLISLLDRNPTAGGEVDLPPEAEHFGGGGFGYMDTVNYPEDPPFAVPRQTDTPEFRRWFGDSKVVDENGEPLVVYHGTPVAHGATEFRSTKFRNVAGYFAEDPAVAGAVTQPITRSDPDRGNVYPVYLSILNPVELSRVDGRQPMTIEAFAALMPFDVSDAQVAEFRESVTRRGYRDEMPVWSFIAGDFWRDMMRAHGFDGIHYQEMNTETLNTLREEGEDPITSAASWVAFRPEQIKSATGNRGTFSETDPDIRFAVPRSVPADRKFVRFDFHPETGFDAARRVVQDKDIRVRRFEEAMLAAGGVVGDKLSTYGALERFPGKVEARLRKWKQRRLEPLFKLLAKNEIDLGEFDRYLYARHAKERNEAIAAQKPELTDGSGMSTKEAASILSGAHRSKKADAYRKAGAMVDAMNRETRQVQKGSGLISQETFDAWEAQYDHYVPLRTSYEDETPGIGSGMGIRGPESKKAEGRGTLAHSPLTYSILQAQRAFVRGSKNEVGNTFLSLIEENPAVLKDFEVRQVQEEHDTEGGEQLPTAPLLRETEFATKVQGKVVAIHVKDPLLRRALQNLGTSDMGPVTRVMASVTRFLSSLNTSWDPGFILTNLARDMQTAGINLAGARSVKIAAKVMRATLSSRPQRAAWRGFRTPDAAKPGDEWLAAFRKLERAGGLVGWFHTPDFSHQLRQVQSEINDLRGNPLRQAKRAAQGFFSFVEDANKAVENGVRLAAFKVALEEGVSEKEAASLAKNLTVNFNRKGELGNMANAWYMFFNASLQGTFLFARYLRSPKVLGIGVGVAVASAWLDAWNRAAGGDDEDGVPHYDKIPGWIKERNLIVMNPDGSGERFMLPLPYGYNIFHAIGQKVGAVKAGAMDLGDAATGILRTAWESFFPLGSEATLAQTLAPTAMDPIVQVGENKTFWGGPIRPQPFDEDTTPRSEQYWSSTVNPHAKAVTAWLNRVAGGSSVESSGPFTDISPEDLEHVVEFALGGAGRQGARVNRLISKVSSGEERLWQDYPILRRFLGEPDERFDRQRYYDHRAEVRRAEKLLRGAEGDAEATTAIRKNKAPLLRLAPVLKETERRLRKVRQAKKAAENAGARERVLALEKQERAIQMAFSKKYLKLVP